jgi:hypothetical protein
VRREIQAHLLTVWAPRLALTSSRVRVRTSGDLVTIEAVTPNKAMMGASANLCAAALTAILGHPEWDWSGP